MFPPQALNPTAMYGFCVLRITTDSFFLSKPFTYAICLNELGDEEVHKYVSHEPSGRGFNEICLDAKSKTVTC